MYVNVYIFLLVYALVLVCSAIGEIPLVSRRITNVRVFVRLTSKSSESKEFFTNLFNILKYSTFTSSWNLRMPIYRSTPAIWQKFILVTRRLRIKFFAVPNSERHNSWRSNYDFKNCVLFPYEEVQVSDICLSFDVLFQKLDRLSDSYIRHFLVKLIQSVLSWLIFILRFLRYGFIVPWMMLHIFTTTNFACW